MKEQKNRIFHTNILTTLAALVVVGKIISNNNAFLLLFLLIIGYGIFTEELEQKILYLIFFSSWIYVLKFNPNSFSLFHVIQLFYLASFIISITIHKRKVNTKILLGFLLFVFYILANYLIMLNGSLFYVVGFLLNFTTISFALSVTKRQKYFKRYVLYYAMGLALSGLVALIGNWIPSATAQIKNMGESYTVFQNNQLFTRFSGLDIDPNYFSFQVLFAIGLLLMTSRIEKGYLKENVLILILIMMGVNTLSKMFLIMLSLLLVYTIITYLRYDVMQALKYSLSVFFVFLVSLPLGLTDFINAILYRFSFQGNSVVAVTTGRSDLWMAYKDEIISNPMLFFIGNGIGSEFLNGFAAHNMYLSYWYFSGLLGVVALLFFLVHTYNQIKMKFNLDRQLSDIYLTKLPLIILISANFALDSIFMNFFPLLLYLTILSLNYTRKTQEAEVANKIKEYTSREKDAYLFVNKN